jgi:rhamnulose-1-phosphate aldolase
MKHLLSPCLLDEIAAVAARVDALGWSEAGAGNLSLLVTARDLARPLHGGEAFELGLSPAFDLTLPPDRYLLITAKGRRMRDLAVDPAAGLRLLGQGREGLFLLRGGGGLASPSSELPCHLAAHLARGEPGALVHAHTDFLVALSLLPALGAEGALESALMNHMPEIRAFLPRGVKRLNYSDPGGEDLARASGTALSEADAVIWEHHGAMAAGSTLSEALDRLEMLEKAARVWWLAHATGELPRHLAARFNA